MSNKKNGFTLIDLMVVIAIISLLSTIILASVRMATSKGRDATRRANLSSVRLSLELYFNDNSGFPLANNETTQWSDSIVTTAIAPFMPNGVPSDPKSSDYNPLYRTNSTGSVYSIRMQYENAPTCKTGGTGVDITWFANAPLCES